MKMRRMQFVSRAALGVDLCIDYIYLYKLRFTVSFAMPDNSVYLFVSKITSLSGVSIRLTLLFYEAGMYRTWKRQASLLAGK